MWKAKKYEGVSKSLGYPLGYIYHSHLNKFGIGYHGNDYFRNLKIISSNFFWPLSSQYFLPKGRKISGFRDTAGVLSYLDTRYFKSKFFFNVGNKLLF